MEGYFIKRYWATDTNSSPKLSVNKTNLFMRAWLLINSYISYKFSLNNVFSIFLKYMSFSIQPWLSPLRRYCTNLGSHPVLCGCLDTVLVGKQKITITSFINPIINILFSSLWRWSRTSPVNFTSLKHTAKLLSS